jgi:tetratricopeptide (TPR) repeat protein
VRIALSIGLVFLLATRVGLSQEQNSLELERVEALQAKIRSAVDQHANPEQVGTLWLSLAKRFLGYLELEKAEDAFARAIHLLRDTSLQTQYADSLDGIARVYLTLGRLGEARSFLTKSLETYAKLKAESNVASIHVALGIVQLASHKYREAEIESATALKIFESEASPDPAEISAAYLLHARAICGEGRCSSALDDILRARSAIASKSPENSIEMISIWMIKGQIQIQAGLQAEGEQAIDEGLRLLQSRTDLPHPVSVALELAILRVQASSLRAAHRKQEAKRTEDQIARIEAEQPATCRGCTVSAAALLSQPGK